jgi:glycosyltransferase involved in cell wall biosynthesis
MLMLHRTMKTFERKITRYIALTEFSKAKFVQAGLPAQRIAVKPNFVDIARAPVRSRSGLLYVGRLSSEKGIAVLGEAWAACPGLRLRVVGSGPEGASLQPQSGVEMLGQQPASAVQREMRSAVALVLPSICYENFPLTIVEAFAAGLPVIASRIGALAELVEDGETGLLFEPGNAQDLARTLRWAAAHPAHMATMGANARLRYETHYTPEINHDQLLAIYRAAIDEANSEVPHERVS